jgi:hypothetical protein
MNAYIRAAQKREDLRRQVAERLQARQPEPIRARNEDGTFRADPATPDVDEAWVVEPQ